MPVADVTTDALGQILGWGAGGVVVLLIIFGFLDPKRLTDQLRLDIQTWKDTYERERTAHDTTRAALEKERQRADAAVEQARATLALLHAREEEPAPRPAPRPRPRKAREG